VLTVNPDPDVVERQLDNRELTCPSCRVGMVRKHGWVKRFVRLTVAAPQVEAGAGRVVEQREKLRRGICAARGCGVTHVLLPRSLLGRRLDEVTVIGRAVTLRLARWSWGRIAERLGRAVSTVRGWWRRLAAGAQQVRVAFTLALHALEWDAPPVLVPAGSAVADAVAAIVETVGAVRRLRSAAVGAVPVWQVVSALTNGGLLRPVPPSRILQHVRA